MRNSKVNQFGKPGMQIFSYGSITAIILGSSDTLRHAISVGVVFAVVIILSYISFLKYPKDIPIVIKNYLVTILAALIYIPAAYMLREIEGEEVFREVGIFLPLVCIVPASLFVTAGKKGEDKRTGIRRIIGVVIYFQIIVMSLGIIREILSNNSIGGHNIEFSFRVDAVGGAAGGFLLIGLLSALVKSITRDRSKD